MIDKMSRRGVLVTRPAHQMEALCQLLETQGFHAIRFPTIAIEPIQDPVIPNLSHYQRIIFISVNAVTFAQSYLSVAQLQKMSVAAIGQKTAQALNDLEIKVGLCPEARFDSESLLALSELHNLTGQSILIVRGLGGREHLRNVLLARGAKVDYFEVYERKCPDISAKSIIQQSTDWHFSIVTSQQVLDNLLQLMGGQGLPLLLQKPLVVMSERVRGYALKKGFKRVFLAKNATNEAIVEALMFF